MKQKSLQTSLTVLAVLLVNVFSCFAYECNFPSEDVSLQDESNAEWFSGSWGIWYQLPGGVRLDSVSTDWVSQAENIVDELPSMGHVILNFTHSAHGYYFLLRENQYVDIANEIHPEFVPSLQNEQIILDVIKTFKDAGKRVILYIATDGPSAASGTPNNEEYKNAWEDYYLNDSKFSGTSTQKEAQAWRLLCRGFFERFRDVGVDGYWLDHTGGMPGEVVDYSNMIREVDPTASLATNSTIDNGTAEFSAYFKDQNGNDLYVDTDNSSEIVGVDGDGDDVNRDYRIKAYNATDPFMDFTGGHPTPLAWGAPPNSWAYEEYTFEQMVNEPWTRYDASSKPVLRHAFVPLRNRWTTFTGDLMFEEEQAYRFARVLTDAGAALTFSATLNGGWWSTASTAGSISADEMEILKEINDRMVQNPKPNYIPYSRPEGAYLVGEDENTAIIPTIPVAPTTSMATIFLQENSVGFCNVDGKIDNIHTGYTGSGFVDTSNENGASITWEINGAAGEYTFLWKYANGSVSNRTADFIINGATKSSIAFNSTESWSSWSNRTRTLTLGAGVKTITLEATTENGLANVDYLQVEGPGIIRTNCSNYLTSSQPVIAIQTVFLQENGVGFCNVDGRIDDAHSGYTSSGFADTSNATGASITWEINGEAGEYTFLWQYANGSVSNRTANFIINGATKSSIAFNSTESWSSWSNRTRTLTLGAGVKTITLEATTENGLANIDYLQIEGPNVIRSGCSNFSAKSITEELGTLQVYPNPVESSFRVSKNILGSKLYDMKGGLLKEFPKGETEFNISDFASGIYIFEAVTENGFVELFKILKK